MGEIAPPRPLAESDDRDGFDCGRDSLNQWFRRHAWRNQRDGLSRTSVLIDEHNEAVAAYISVCAAEIERAFLPKPEQRNRPDPIPAILLGQLAVDSRYQRRQFAKSLVTFTFRTVVRLSADLDCFCLLTDPIDDGVRQFYQRFDFRDLPFDQGRRMFVSVADLVRNGFSAD